MSEAQAKPQSHIEEPKIVLFPQTPEQLDHYIAAAVSKFLSIPENQTLIAQVVVSGLARSLTNDRERLEKDMNRLILVKAPFPGSIKAVVFQKSEEELGVNFFQLQQSAVEGEAPSWTQIVADERNPQAKLDALANFVLAKATVVNETWYITTSKAVDAAAQEGADLLAIANGAQ